MAKRRNVELYTGEVADVDRKDEFASELRNNLHHCFVYTAKSLVSLVPNQKEVKRILNATNTANPNRTVHTKHPRIRKRSIPVEFTVTPSQVPPGERILLPLEDFDPLPHRPAEVISGRAVGNGPNVPLISPNVDSSRMLIHDIRLVGVSNPCPFVVCLGSNFFSLISDYTKAYQSFAEDGAGALDRLMGKEPWEMPELPGDSSMFEAKPQFEGFVDEARNHCMRRLAGFLEPEYGRAAVSSLDRQALFNGIYMMQLAHPHHGHITDFGLLPVSHAVAVFAMLNWDEYNVLITWGTQMRPADHTTPQRYILMERDLIEKLVATIVEERQNAVPLCESDRLVLELKRYVNNSNWSSPIGCLGGTTSEDMSREYTIKWELELEYSLFERPIQDSIITLPSMAKTLALEDPENSRQVEERIQAEAELRVKRQDMDIDLATL